MPAGAYDWREWAGEAVVFVHATGDTHALSAQASALVAAMRRHPDEAHTTAGWLVIAGRAVDAGDSESEDSLMQGLLAIGLVRRSP